MAAELLRPRSAPLSAGNSEARCTTLGQGSCFKSHEDLTPSHPMTHSSFLALHYLRSKLCALIVPQQSPRLSTTGKLVALCSWSLRRTSSRDSSLPQHAFVERMISSTRTSDARRSSAATLWHTSRSVTTPTTLRLSLSLTTGEQPHPVLRIVIEACCAVSRGVQHESAFTGSILSLQQLILSFSMIVQTTFKRVALRWREQNCVLPSTRVYRRRGSISGSMTMLHQPFVAGWRNTRVSCDRVYGVTLITIVKPPPPCSSTLLFVV
jgi:hypothetical protein